MDKVTVKTNNVPRNVIDAWELTPKEQEEFDYLDWKAIAAGEDSARFIRYRGELYDLGNFEIAAQSGYYPALFGNTSPEWLKAWDGFCSESFFSGVLIRYMEDFEQVIVGRYYC